MTDLTCWGLDPFFQDQLEADGDSGRRKEVLGRVIRTLRGELTVVTEEGERTARISGSLRHR